MNDTKPLISVIMPAYRCKKTIEAAIDSVLMQDVDLELLVIDDKSPDHLEDVMKKYADDTRVIYSQNSERLGAAASRNRGVSLAQGKYIAFLDSDDCWREEKLKKQLACMEREDVVLCATARQLMTHDGKPMERIFPVQEHITYRDLLKHNSIACSSVLIRADVAREFPMGYEDSHEDYILWMQILRKYRTACGLNEPLLLYRLSNHGKSGNKFKSARMTFKAYRYMGFGMLKSLCCFMSYAWHGVQKYYLKKE